MKIKKLIMFFAIFALNASVVCASQPNFQSKEYKELPEFQWTEFFARVTEYSKKDKHVDEDTAAGRTSTQVPVQPACKDDGKIGVVAVDPKVIPYGSLIILQDGRKYLAADTGDWVISRRAAINLAKKEDRAQPFSDALVLDFYSYDKILPENWANVYVLKDTIGNFKQLPKREKLRPFDPEFWEQVSNRNSG